MRYFLAVLLLSLSAHAAAPDAPTVAPAIIVDAGWVAPSLGLFLPSDRAILEAKRIAKCEAEVADAKAGNSLLPVPALIAIIVGAFVVGAAAGAGVAVAVAKK